MWCHWLSGDYVVANEPIKSTWGKTNLKNSKNVLYGKKLINKKFFKLKWTYENKLQF
jgi:hypothetical protein